MLQASNSNAKSDIVRQLEKLNQWQVQQKQLLEERQSLQRIELGLEQKNLYEKLGLQLLHETTNEDETNDGYAEDVFALEDLCNLKPSNGMEKAPTQASSSIKTSSSLSFASAESSRMPAFKPKRNFLKRGEGLKQRFKIDPEALRLNNLPRYKFAGAHPKFKNAKRHQPLERKKSCEYGHSTISIPLDDQEARFQQMLFTSKITCNSTPDLKSSHNPSEDLSSFPKVRFADSAKQRKKILSTEMAHNQQTSTPTEDGNPTPLLLWSKVLDPQQIKPIAPHKRQSSMEANNNILQEQDLDFYEEDLSIFELLEQKANDGTIDMNSSCVRKFIERKTLSSKHDDSDIIPVDWQLKENGLTPLAREVLPNDYSSDSDQTGGDDDNATAEQNEVSENTTACTRSVQEQEMCEFVDEITAEAAMLDGNGSTLTNNQIFQEFKAALFAALQNKAENATNPQDTTCDSNAYESDIILSTHSKELQEKTNLIKIRLSELEREIAVFKDNNVQLMRAKQEHELEQARCMQEHLEAVQKLNDDKIAMEIGLHDERMKIEKEKRELEQQTRMQRSSTTTRERREIASLREEIDALQAQLKQKEQTHIASNSRLRAQIRNMEKDQKQLLDDIEQLNKENKRLEKHIMQIERENSNKMLQEINRNIARLAPKPIVPPDESVVVSRSSGSKKVTNAKQATQKIAKSHQHGKILTKHKPKSAVNERSAVSEISAAKPTVSADESSLSEAESEEFVSLHGSLNTTNFKSATCSPSQTEESATPLENSNVDQFKREIINTDGSKDIWYPNGNLKKISADSMTIRMLYFNKDIKETNINEGTVKYYYADSNTWHTTYLDGLEILEFPNGQTEHRYKNGVIEVYFPNNSIKVINTTDEHQKEEWRLADGTNVVEMHNGDRILTFPNGQKETHTKLNKRREYPDGTVKLVYPDGSQETRYSNGRRRLKDKDGNLVLDSANTEY